MPVKSTVKKTVKKKPKKLTLDDLLKTQEEAWAAIRETQQAVKETHKSIFGLDNAKEEAWKAIRETQQAHRETEKAIRETQQAVKETHKNIFGLDNAKEEAWKAIRETQKAVKETQKNIGGLNNTLGSIVERILTPGLPGKFKKLGYSFNRIASYSYTEGVWAQIDGMLENGSQAIAVEVKTKLHQTDVDDHLVRMEKIRKFADEHGDKRQFMGAMATLVTDENAKNYALKKGLFVIEPSGEDVKVTKPETEPRVW